MSETRTRPARLRRKTRRERPAAEQAALSSTRRPDDDGGAKRSSAGSPALTGRAPIPSRQALALALLVAISYLPALEAGFVWDDLIFVEEAAVHHWSGLWSIWFSPAEIEKEGHYWPVVYTSFWLDHKLWGLEPLGYHAVNVALHLVNVLLAWFLLRRLAVPGAWVIAAVFAVHPLHVESVAWVMERKDLLSALFYLAAALTWIRFVKTPRPGRYALALGLFAAALLSKSIAVTLPAALLIYHWWQAGRVTRTDLARLAPFFGVALVITALDLSFYTSREPLDLGYSLAERVLIAARALWFYAGKLVWPADLAVIYPLWDVSAADPVAWAYVAAAAALAAALWFGRQRLGRGPLAGILFFAVTLSPVLGFVDYGYMQFSLVADRFQYLAGLGVLAVLLGAARRGVDRLPSATRTAAAAALILVLAMLGALTWRQAGIYRDEVTFFSHILAHNPNARDAHLNLVGPLSDAGRLEDALAAARAAVEQRPDHSLANSNLGRTLVLLNRFEEAEGVLRTARKLDPRNATAHQNLGEALRRQERYEEAIATYRAALAIKEDYAAAHGGLGAVLFELERYGESFAALERSLALDPGAPSAGKTALFAGRAARKLGRSRAAEAQFRKAAALAPGSAEPLLELSNLLFAQDRAAEAEESLRRARELRPNDPSTLHMAAEALRTAGRRQEAVCAYRNVLRSDPEFAPAHVGLGAALFDLQRYEEALKSLERAASLETDPATAATSHFLAGRALKELGRMPEAAARFQQAVESDPNHAEALDHLALWRFQQRRYQEALDLYRAQSALKPDSVTTHANIGVTLYFLGRPEEALAAMEQVLQLDPDHPMARKLVEELRRNAAQPAR
ncbi:MAG: tetratricopeptide repeat protein [Acidobacteriota bacterium]|nr:tetratricopeptide repeat protein [Acidobacteriota bacterium]